MTTTLLPAWKNVVAAVQAGRWGYGDLIPHEDLYELLMLPQPRGNATADQYKNWRLRVLSEVTAMSEHLLTEMQMALKSEPGVGYRILQPADQTRVAEIDLGREIARAFRFAALRIKHVNHKLLSADESQQNTAAAQRLAAKRDALRRVDRLPAPQIKALPKSRPRKKP